MAISPYSTSNLSFPVVLVKMRLPLVMVLGLVFVKCTQAQQALFIETPTMSACQISQINWGGGTAPYSVYV